ncbi:MAG: hypothetical protein ABIZ09_00350 [Rhodoferax sp.]|jgi:hypothetical protein
MKLIKLHHALVCMAIICLHGLATAEVPSATAEALMRKSGVWAQLADVATQVKAGMAKSAEGTSLTPEDSARLDQIADDAFSAARLRDTVMQVLSHDITAAQSVDALRWFDSAAGKQITALEEAFSANFEDMNQVMEDGNQLLAQTSTKRQSLLSQVVTTSRVAESMAGMQISSTLAIMQGLANALPNSDAPPLSELRAALESQRAQMVAANRGVALSMLALNYQAASDKVLAQYIKFLSSKSGIALTLSMETALDKSLANASQLLGSGMPKVPGTTSL